MIDIVERQDAGDDVRAFNGILCPGFVNTHCHLELSHLKGVIPEGTGLVEFVQQVMSKREPPLRNSGGLQDLEKEREAKYAAIESAVQELYESGTIAIADICNTTDTIPVKKKNKLQYHNFIEVTGFTDVLATNRLEKVTEILSEFLTVAPSRTTLSPHAPYSVSKTLFHALNDLTANQLITIHNQESSAENELYEYKGGGFLQLYKNFGIDISGFTATAKSSLQSWLPYFNRRQSIILVHNTFIENEDIAFVNKYISLALNDVHYCICINANKYIEDTIPPLELLRNNSSNIVLGTDSYASNRHLNLFEEIKTIEAETVGYITLPEILRWATYNGARALNMEDELGSFDKGKRPGLVLIEKVENLKLAPDSIARRIL